MRTKLPHRRPPCISRLFRLAALALAGLAAAPSFAAERANVLILTVDTLRADRLSAYGHERPTSPHIDRLIDHGVRFTRARTVEPLTSPALCSMLTSQHPHEHGSSRNGLRMRAGLTSLPKVLRAEGWATAALVGNWTLRDKLSGLGEHFEQYDEVLNRRRWFGLLRRESTADDLTEAAVEWLGDHSAERAGRPFLLWVHYVEPHAPYLLHEEHAARLGIDTGRRVPPELRYETEIAAVDASIGELLGALEGLGLDESTLVVFASDHGESLGEHNYWGHGRHLYEPTLLIPMSLTWPGRLAPATIDAPALNLDLAPTILGLLGVDAPSAFAGYDWTAVLRGRREAPAERVTWHQAHRGAVISNHDSDLARRAGLLAVARVDQAHKEIFRVENGRHSAFHLIADPGERDDLTPPKIDGSEALMDWLRVVYRGLNDADADAEPPQPLDAETAAQLRSLGYTD